MTNRQNIDESPDVTLRSLSTFAEYHQCVELQKETWGQDFTEAIPPSLLIVTQRIGGVAAGAFDSSDRLVGFVIGFSGVREGQLVHWSDMLAVRKEMSGKGVGRRLKEYQRKLLLELGIETAIWTFDPLVASNAHFNINRLGALPAEYIVNMYGSETGSILHAGIGTDRFIIEWKLTDPLVEKALRGEIERWELKTDTSAAAQSPVVNTLEGTPQPVEGELPELPSVQVEIPYDIQPIKTDSLELALLWRNSTRRAFLWYMERGYRVDGFRLDTETCRCYYLLNNSFP